MESLRRFVAGVTSAIVTFVAVFSVFPAVSSVTLAADNTPDWATDYVEFLQENEFVNTGAFYGGNLITRAEFAKMVYTTGVAAGIVTEVSVDDLDETLFADVPKYNANGTLNWQFEYVVGLRSQGFLAAKSEFRPNEPINRAEAAQLVANVYGYDDDYTGSSVFSDLPEWAFDAVHNLYNAGIVAGIGGGKFGAGDNITRGAVAKIMTGAYIFYTTGQTLAEYFGEETSTPSEEEPTDETPDASMPKVGTLEVRVASDTPKGTNVPRNAISIPTVKLELTASNHGDIVIKGMKTWLFGLISNSNVNQVWVTDEDGQRIGNTRSLTTNNNANLVFNTTPIVVRAGSTRTLTLNMSLKDTATLQSNSTFTLGFKALDDITSSAQTVVMDAPLRGNEMVTSGYTVTTVKYTAQLSNVVSTVDAGDTQEEIGRFKLQNSGQNDKDVVIKSFTVKTGSPSGYTGANSSKPTLTEVLDNVQVRAEGKDLLKSYYVSGDYLTLVFADGTKLEDGKSRLYTILADVLGSGNTNEALNFYIDDQEDFVAYEDGTMFGVPLLLENGSTVAEGYDATRMGAYNINVGDLTVTKKSGHVADAEYSSDTDDVTLLEATVLVGSPIELDGLKVRLAGLTGTTSTLIDTASENADFMEAVFENVELYLNGELIDTASNTVTEGTGTGIGSAGNYYEFDTTFEIEKTSTLTVRADIKNNIRAYDGLSFKFLASSADFEDPQYISTGDTIPPARRTGSATGNKVEIQTSALTLTRNDGYGSTIGGAETIVVGAEDIVLIRFVLNANNSSDLTVTNINLTTAENSGTQVSQVFTGVDNSEDNLVTNLGIYIKGVLQGDTKDLNNANFSDVNFVVPAGSSVEVEVKGTLSQSLTDTAYLQLAVSSVTAYDVSGDTVEILQVDGDLTGSQPLLYGGIIAFSSGGTLNVTTDANTPDTSLLLGGVSDQHVFNIKFQAEDDPIRISELVLVAVDADGDVLTDTAAEKFVDQVKSISIYDKAGNLLDSESPVRDGTASSAETFVRFDMGSKGILVPKDGQALAMVKVSLNDIKDTGDTGLTVRLAVDTNEAVSSVTSTTDGVEAVSVSTSATLEYSHSGSPVVSDTFFTVNTQPTITVLPKASQASGDVLVGGTAEVLRFSVSADARDDIELTKLSFQVSPSGLEIGAGDVNTGTGTAVLYEVKNGVVNTGTAFTFGSTEYTTFNSTQVIEIEMSQVLEVSAGSSKTFALFLSNIDDVGGTSGDTLSVSLLSDDSDGPIGPDTSANLTGDYNFVWSDQSNPQHTSSSADFFNGFQIPGLPTTPYTRFR